MRKFNFEILEIKKSNNNEILTQTCLGFIDDIIKFYSLDKKDNNTYSINKIKRLSDGVIFTVGDNVYINDSYEIIEDIRYSGQKKSGVMIFFENNDIGTQFLENLKQINNQNYMKQNLLNFIKQKEPNIRKVLSFKLNDFDGDHGFSGESYIVNCLVEQPKINTTASNILENKEKTCIVNRRIFEDFVKQEESVKWI